jgi:hypothetical protein
VGTKLFYLGTGVTTSAARLYDPSLDTWTTASAEWAPDASDSTWQFVFPVSSAVVAYTSSWNDLLHADCSERVGVEWATRLYDLDTGRWLPAPAPAGVNMTGYAGFATGGKYIFQWGPNLDGTMEGWIYALSCLW